MVQGAAEYASSKGGALLWTQAAYIGKRCWKTTKIELGDDHTDTLTSMSNLAGYYRRLGESSKAAETEERCWEMRKKALGEDHPETLISMGHLASYLRSQGPNASAIRLQEDCVQASGGLRSSFRRTAFKLQEDCVQASISKLGYEHPVTRKRAAVLSEWRSG